MHILDMHHAHVNCCLDPPDVYIGYDYDIGIGPPKSTGFDLRHSSCPGCLSPRLCKEWPGPIPALSSKPWQ